MTSLEQSPKTEECERLRTVLEGINSHVQDVARAVTSLACDQRQLDEDGVEVGVSRQAADECAGALNTIAIVCCNALASTPAGKPKQGDD